MYAIPREQIVGVGRRRYLMKRALVDIVPDEILNRRKKETVPEEPPKKVSAERMPAEWPSWAELGQHIVGSSVGIIALNRFLQALQKVRSEEEVDLESLKRTLMLESWLRHLTMHGVLKNPTPTKNPDYYSRYSEWSEESLCVSLETRKRSVPAQPKSSAS